MKVKKKAPTRRRVTTNNKTALQNLEDISKTLSASIAAKVSASPASLNQADLDMIKTICDIEKLRANIGEDTNVGTRDLQSMSTAKLLKMNKAATKHA